MCKGETQIAFFIISLRPYWCGPTGAVLVGPPGAALLCGPTSAALLLRPYWCGPTSAALRGAALLVRPY